MKLELEVELSKKNFALKKAEERLQISLEQWQDERAALQRAIDRLQLTEKEKWEGSERESNMAARMDGLESRVTEMLEKKSKKKKCWLTRHF